MQSKCLSYVHTDLPQAMRVRARTPAGALLRSLGVAAARVLVQVCVCEIAVPGSVLSWGPSVRESAGGTLPPAPSNREPKRRSVPQVWPPCVTQTPCLNSNAIARQPYGLTSLIFRTCDIITERGSV